ncbi:transposase [Marinobacter bryozoorum]|uniref:transposase n=1 Tax=Marinobacter bryozoorum TaxID=256324 RepID=UPI003CFF4E06
MSKAYIRGLGQHLPNAEVTFDRFHIFKLAKQALECRSQGPSAPRPPPEANPIGLAEGHGPLEQNAG